MEQEVTNIAKRIGRRVKAIRQQRGYSQHELAAKCNMSNQTISNIETGRGIFNFASIAKIESVLGCSFVVVPNEDFG